MTDCEALAQFADNLSGASPTSSLLISQPSQPLRRQHAGQVFEIMLESKLDNLHMDYKAGRRNIGIRLLVTRIQGESERDQAHHFCSVFPVGRELYSWGANSLGRHDFYCCGHISSRLKTC